MSDESKKYHVKIEKEDVPTQSVRKRWVYWLFIKNAKWFFSGLIIFGILAVAGFPFVMYVTDLNKGWGILGSFIMLGYGIKYVFLGWWFITKRAWVAYFLGLLVYPIIKRFIHSERVGLRELGSQNTYFFKITTTADGYLLHEDKFFGLRKIPVYLDKVTVQYFKENGSQRVLKEKGKKDDSYLELDIVPLSWKGDSLLITDEETRQRFLNNRILVTHEIRDLFSMTIKGLPPTEQEVEKNIIYETILGTADLRQELIKAKYHLRNIDVERLEMVLDVALPPTTEEYLRHERVQDKATEPYDKVVDSDTYHRELKELSQIKSRDELIEKLAMMYVSEEEN